MEDLSLEEIMELDRKFVFQTYRRIPVAFVKGEGTCLFDTEEKKYLDFIMGIAVCPLGHGHPKLVGAIKSQAERLLHTSNLYYIGAQALLAKRLCEISGMSRAFFCNSGAEAVEAALKLARKWGQREKGPQCFEIVAAEGSFHGRTLATITATGQAKYREGFGPLLPGVVYAKFNDLYDFSRKVDEMRTCAVLVEPIQGEVGVRPGTREFLKGLREICTGRGVALLFDEIQTAVGRTGEFFAFQHYGVEPDIVALAKGLGGGVPIGAMLAREPFASAFGPGDHASTFGGNFLACCAALAVLDVVVNEGLLGRVKKVAQKFGQLLEKMASQLPFVKEARGVGLMRAVEFEPPIAKRVEVLCRERGLLVNPIGDYIIRMHPPLIVTEEQVEEAVSILTVSAEEAAREVSES